MPFKLARSLPHLLNYKCWIWAWHRFKRHKHKAFTNRHLQKISKWRVILGKSNPRPGHRYNIFQETLCSSVSRYIINNSGQPRNVRWDWIPIGLTESSKAIPFYMGLRRSDHRHRRSCFVPDGIEVALPPLPIHSPSFLLTVRLKVSDLLLTYLRFLWCDQEFYLCHPLFNFEYFFWWRV